MLQERRCKVQCRGPGLPASSASQAYNRHEEQPMTIEIRDAALEARLQKQLKSIGSRSVEELLLHLLETQEEQDRWLSENREGINAKIWRGIEQLDRGEGIPDSKLAAHLTKLKAKLE